MREALDGGLSVTSIPGASAVMAALTSAGLPTDTFLFGGFLPVKSGARRKRLEELKPAPATLLLFETGSRLAKSLADMAEVLGAREAAVAKELTKLHETVTRGTLDRLAAATGAAALKGEFVVVIAPPAAADAEASDEAIAAALQEALARDELSRCRARGRRALRPEARPRLRSRSRPRAQRRRRAVSEKRIRAYRHGLLRRDRRRAPAAAKGNRILARRYKTPVGEIDLVALKGKRLAFVEVKQRRTMDDASWALPTRARRRIVRAAQYWLVEPSRFRRLRHRLRRGAGGAVGVAALHRQRLSGLTQDCHCRA